MSDEREGEPMPEAPEEPAPVAPEPSRWPLPDLRERPRLRRTLLAAAALLVGCVYLLPQVLFTAAGHDGVVYLHVDEPGYAARVARCAQGQLAPSDPWTWEHRDTPGILPPLPEASLSALSLVGLSTDAMVCVGRFLLAVLGVVAIYLAVVWLGYSPWLGLFAGCWIYLDAGVMHYKPLVHVALGQAGLPFNRFSNPLFGLPLFFLGWGLAGRAFLNPEHHRRDAALAGVLLGLSFYVSLFYWSHLIPALALAAVVGRAPHRWRVLGWGALVTTLVALPYVISLLSLRQHPVYPDIAWRNGLMIADRGWYLLPNKTLWLFVIAAAAAVVRSPRPQDRYLGVGIAAGLACYFSPLVTGRSLQNFHYAYTLAPLLYLGVFLLAAQALVRFERQRGWLVALSAVALLANLGTALVSVGLQHRALTTPSRTNGVGAVDQGYQEAWAWLRANAQPEEVVLCAPTVQVLVPARTGLHVWQARCVELIPFEELLERNQVLWAVTQADLEVVLDPGAHPVSQWWPGLPAERAERLRAEGRPPFDRDRVARLGQELIALQATLSRAQILERARRYRLDYLVRGPREAGWAAEAERWLVLEPLVEAGAVRIDRVRGWKDAP